MDTRKLVFIGTFSAIAFILMATISIPILPHAQHLRYDPSEIASILVAIIFGPWTGVAVCFFKDLFYFFFRAVSIFGPTADFIASSIFTFTIGIIYSLKRNKKSLIIGGIIATIVRIIVMIPMNLVILRLQFGLSTKQIIDMLVPILIPFNFLKASINFLAFYVIFSFLLKRTHFSKKFIQPDIYIKK